MAKRWTKLEQSQRREREEELDRDRPDLDFSDQAADPGWGDSYFGFRRDKPDRRSGDHYKKSPKPKRASFLSTLPPEERGFSLYRNPQPGWAANQEWAWSKTDSGILRWDGPPFALKAMWEAGLVVSEPPIFLGGRPTDWLPDLVGQLFERSAFYFVAGEWIKPSAKLELKRMPSLPRFQKSPLLTKSYLDGTPDRLLQRTWGVIHALRFLDAGGLIQVCPPETTTRQLNRRRVGRPALNGVAMTAAERKRRSRLKTLPPQERLEPGAAVPLSLRPAVPGNYQSVWMGIVQMVTEVELGLASKWHERLGTLLEKLASAPPDYLLSWEEFRLLGAAAVLQERSAPDVLQ